jgi:hypothetical protein
MDAVTYPQPKVTEFITANIIPLRVPFDAQPLATDYSVKWTPTLITTDTTGKEHHRTVGFLPHDELVPSLLLGMSKVHFDLDQFSNAIPNLDKIITEYPGSNATPEAIYLRGVSLYKSTHDPKPLKQAYEKLEKEYPSSEWVKRAQPYSLL